MKLPIFVGNRNFSYLFKNYNYNVVVEVLYSYLYPKQHTVKVFK